MFTNAQADPFSGSLKFLNHELHPVQTWYQPDERSDYQKLMILQIYAQSLYHPP